MKPVLTLACAYALTGCATTEYAAYIKAHEAQSVAQAARYQALAEIARSGDTTAKVAAVISLQAGGQGQQQSFIAPPKSVGEQALQWAGLILPVATQVYAVKNQTAVALRQSDNAALVARSTNDAFVGIAGKIQAPAANVVTTNQATTTTTSTSVGRDGVIGDGTLTRTCAAGTGGPGAGGAAGGSAVVAPALASSGAPGAATATGGAGAPGGAGGAGGALNC